jgi:hypothetical protein
MGAGKSAVKGVAAFATNTKKFVDTVTKGNPIANAMGAVTGLISGFSKLAVFAAVLVPMLLVAGALFAVVGVAAVAVAGIAAYLVSKWDELSASILKGFEDGSITLKPLVTAAMLLWEKLKKLGEALIGGTTGGEHDEVGDRPCRQGDRRHHDGRRRAAVHGGDVHPLGRQGRGRGRLRCGRNRRVQAQYEDRAAHGSKHL